MARSIVLAVRVGEASLATGRTASWLARDLGATITVLYVAEELRTVAEVATAGGLDDAVVRDRMVSEAKQRATELGREMLGSHPFEVVVAEGEVAEEVAALAREVKADLVVAGSRGRGAIQSVILGDTTREILRKSPCPVVVVPAALDDEAPGNGTDAEDGDAAPR